MHIFNLVSILAAISHVLADPPHGSEQSAKVVACETSLKLLSMGNKAFSDNEKVADKCQSPPFMFLFRTSDRPEIVELRTENVNRTDIEEPKINEPGYHALVEENVKASVRRIVTNPGPSFVLLDSLVVRLECSVIHNNDEPLSLASSASITPPGQRGYRAHYSSLNLFSDIPRHLSPSPPAPVWDIPPHSRQLILPPSTPAAAVVVSLAIGATASVGTTFGVERIERRFDVWRLRWVRAAAARRGGDEEDNPHAADVDSIMLLDTDDYFQLGAKSRECHFTSYSPGQHQYRVRSNHFFTSGNDNLDMTLTLQPPHLDVEPSESHSLESSPAPSPRFCYLQVAPSTQQAMRTRSRDGSRMWKLMEKGQIFERKIEAEKARLEKIREAVARRGGEGDDNPFMALCNSGVLDAECTARTDSAVMMASLYADDYLQCHIDRLYEATTNVTNLAASQPPNFANILDLAPPTDDQLPSLSLQDPVTPLPSQSHIVPSAPNPVRTIHSVFTSTHDYSILSFLEQRPSAPTLPPNPSNPEGLDTEELPSRSPSPFIVPVPVMPPPTLQFHIAPATPKAIQTRSLDPSISWCLMEKGQISEKIEADKVREAAAQRGGVLDWGVMDRRADRGVHERDNTARGTWIHQEIYSDSLPAEHEFTSSCNSIMMPLDPSHPLGRDGRSIVRVSASGCGLRRGQDSTPSISGFVFLQLLPFLYGFRARRPLVHCFSPGSLAFPQLAGFSKQLFAGFLLVCWSLIRLRTLVHFRALVLHPYPHLRSPLSTLKTRCVTYTLLQPSTMPSTIS